MRLERRTELVRPSLEEGPIDAVRDIIEQVRTRGDEALFEFTRKFDGVTLKQLRVEPSASHRVPDGLLEAMKAMKQRIEVFAEHQALKPWVADVGGGSIGEAVHPLRRAGIYVPGGRAVYPSSVLMCAVPARVAGVDEIALCVPPGPDGRVPEATLAAAALCGIEEIYSVGGAQAIAAMAYGTETIAKVDVIVGPGNVYVALAKQELAGIVAIDSVAGPSEIVIVADASAEARFIARDLVAQAEHGPNGAFALITWDEDLLDAVERELHSIEGPDDVAVGVLVSDLEAAIELSDNFAPEHLELMFEGVHEASGRFRSAGAIFIGPHSPVSLGDYLAGTNHVLPTAGSARWASGLRTSHFQRTSATVEYDRKSLHAAAPFIETMAQVEGLPNHSRAVLARFEDDV